MILRTIDRIRKPEFTGENRCLPCTILNSIIAILLAAGLGLLWLPAGIVVLGIFAALIYLRGYLVPGTPELTQRYFPAWVLLLFGKESVDTPGATAEGPGIESTANGSRNESPTMDYENVLLSSGVVEECTNEDDLCLTDSFRDVWWRRIRQFRDDNSRAVNQLAAVIEVDPRGLSLQPEDDYFNATFEGNEIGRWASDAAFYADLAVEPSLSEWIANWKSLGDRKRTELISGMRAFLEICPACEAELHQVEDVRSSCCSGDIVTVSVTCEECGAEVVSGSYR